MYRLHNWMQFWRNDIHRFGQNYQEKHYFGLNFQEKNLEGLPQPIFAKKRCAIALSYCVINGPPIFSFCFARSSTLSKICWSGFILKKPQFFLEILYRDWRFDSQVKVLFTSYIIIIMIIIMKSKSFGSSLALGVGFWTVYTVITKHISI